LSLYNFTIDENDPNDADVALDPELLGKVFENLLASYNPETSKTARKSTGSYYTPRPIVDYMVDESLKQYFRTHLCLKGADNTPVVGEGNNSIRAVGEDVEIESKNVIKAQIESKDALDTLNNFTFFNPYDEIDIYHSHNLPHWQQKNVWYFITFRLADSLPKETMEEIRKEREKWLIKHKKNNNEPYSLEELKEYYRLFSERFEKLLDDCRGSCVLRQEKIAKIVADTLLYFNNKKYILDDWVIMPNHVHILVKPIDDYTLPEITHSWKSFTANEINKLLGRRGQLWLHESYDHIVRNEKAFYAIKNYIRNNPIKANIKLPICAQSWTYKVINSAESILAVGVEEGNNSIRAVGADAEIESKNFINTLVESKDALDTLFSDEEGNPFDEATTVKLVSLIDSLRAVDPAVGSGAFPMRLLNRLVFLLHKLDPENKLWKKSQIDGIKKSVKDPILQRKFIEQIEKKFSEKNPDYGRKLYLIEKCIYGVDIQQIAVEIAKLRFFISLLVDEKIDYSKPNENYGIEPLPNLDFKLMQGNSLISSFAGIDFNTKPDEKDNLFSFDDRYKKLIEEFEELKSQYQNEPDVEAKRILKDEIDKKLLEIFEEKLNQHFPQLKEINEKAAIIKNEAQRKDYIEKEKKNLFKKIGIDLDQAEKDLISYTEGRKQKNFFLWDVYFAEVFTDKGGFDIVIGNPPYGNLLKDSEKKFVSKFFNYSTTSEISSSFIEQSIKLLTNKGNLSFIITYAITFSKDFSKNREQIADNFEFSKIFIFDRDKCRIFENMTQTVAILQCFNKKSIIKKGIYSSRMFRETPDIYKIEVANCNKYLLPKKANYKDKHRLPKIGEDINRQILDKIMEFNYDVKEILKYNSAKIWIRTSGNYWYNAFDKQPYHSVEISPLFVDNDFADFLILLINSSLFYFWFRIYGDGRHMNIDMLKMFPIPKKEKIIRYNILLKKMRIRFVNKLFSVFEKDRNRFLSER
jgi:REP element-mobilizing transposase RayT